MTDSFFFIKELSLLDSGSGGECKCSFSCHRKCVSMVVFIIQTNIEKINTILKWQCMKIKINELH